MCEGVTWQRNTSNTFNKNKDFFKTKDTFNESIDIIGFGNAVKNEYEKNE